VNLLLFSGADRNALGQVVVRGRRFDHLKRVLKAVPGDRVRLGELGGRMGSGEILALATDHALLVPTLDRPPPPKLPLDLVLALPRPKMLRRILRTVAECGVPRLHLVNSYRVEKSYWQTPLLAADAMREYLLQGLEQARDTMLPEVTCYRGFKPFVEDCLPALCAGRRALVAHPGDHPPCPRGLRQPTLLSIGPEGGVIPYEIDKFRDAGCDIISLGPRILRVETAVAHLVGRLT
jgi:RsmE family RNA methyltransferase